MPGNVLTWDQAVRLGYRMDSFSHHPQGVPFGNVQAELHFKIWAQKIMGINCYFMERVSRQQFCITVYCTNQGYYLPGSSINFSTCPTGVIYQLEIAIGTTGKIALVQAALVPTNDG